jgi:hypothetical protein
MRRRDRRPELKSGATLVRRCVELTGVPEKCDISLRVPLAADVGRAHRTW